MPTDVTLRHAGIKEAERLGDLYGVRADLSESQALCAVAEKFDATSDLEDFRILSAIVSSAIIRYMRCFGTGKRFNLGEDVFDAMHDSWIPFHRRLKDIRDKFIAHPVNAFEDSFVNVVCPVVDGEMMPIRGVSAGQITTMFSIGDAKDLSELIRGVFEHVESLIRYEEMRVLAHIHALPLGTVHGWDMHTSAIIKDASKPRSRFAGKKKN